MCVCVCACGIAFLGPIFTELDESIGSGMCICVFNSGCFLITARVQKVIDGI